MIGTATQPLGFLSSPPSDNQVRRELEHIHKILNQRINGLVVIEPKSGNFSLINGDSGKIFLVNTGSARSVLLPAPANGLSFVIKDSSGQAGANNVTIFCLNGESIDGASTKVISTNYGSVQLVSDGVNWYSL